MITVIVSIGPLKSPARQKQTNINIKPKESANGEMNILADRKGYFSKTQMDA